MHKANQLFNTLIEKKYSSATDTAKELLDGMHPTQPGETSLDLSTELNTGKLGKLLNHNKK